MCLLICVVAACCIRGFAVPYFDRLGHSTFRQVSLLSPSGVCSFLYVGLLMYPTAQNSGHVIGSPMTELLLLVDRCVYVY